MSELLSTKQTIDKIGISKSTLQRLRAAGNFPEPKRLSPRRIAWNADDIAAWLASR
tara:strand:+ start:3842 stop:4009 length:168 start_codon:yes stop_codon:yes gene_type:complete